MIGRHARDVLSWCPADLDAMTALKARSLAGGVFAPLGCLSLALVISYVVQAPLSGRLFSLPRLASAIEWSQVFAHAWFALSTPTFFASGTDKGNNLHFVHGPHDLRTWVAESNFAGSPTASHEPWRRMLIRRMGQSFSPSWHCGMGKRALWRSPSLWEFAAPVWSEAAFPCQKTS